MGQRADKSNPLLFVNITRVDEEERMVYGYATTEALDSHGTIIDLGSVEKCLPDYLKWRNVREMHQPSAVGTADEVTLDDKGLYLGAHIVDDQAWRKVTAGVYKGFSIGGSKDYQIGNRIYLKKINEITLGDRPSNEECTFDTFRLYQQEEDMNKSDTTRVTVAGDITRGIYSIGNLGGIIQSLAWLAQDAATEAMFEGDGSPVPGELAVAIKGLCEIMKKMTTEELDELTAGLLPAEVTTLEVVMTAKEADTTRTEEAETGKEAEAPAGTTTERIATADVTRAGARHSAGDLERIQAIHDHCAGLGALCCEDAERITRIAAGPGKVLLIGDAADETVQRIQATMTALGLTFEMADQVPAADSGEVFRIAGLDRDIPGLAGAKEVLTEVVTRLAELEAQPEPAKGVKTPVTVPKEADAGSTDVTRTTEEPAEPPKTPLEAIQRIHQAGGVAVNRVGH